MTPRQARAGAVAAVAGVLVLAVAGAAVGGPWRLQPPPWQLRWDHPVRQPTAAPATISGTPSPDPSPTSGTGLHWLGLVAVGLAALALVVLLHFLWRRYRGSALRASGGGRPAETVVLPASPDVPVLRQGVTAAQRLLEEITDPDNAVVAAWVALQDAAAASGVARRPSETPTEFTVDVLRATAADPQATRQLLALYHRARFSSVGVTRADVRDAAACLEVLGRGLDALSAAVGAAVDRETAAHRETGADRETGERQ